jgi:hypothetical protein
LDRIGTENGKGIGMKKVHSVIVLSFLIILLLLTSVNGAEDWVKYSVDKEGNAYSYNKITIKHRTENVVEVWEKVVFSNAGKEKYVQNLKNMGWWMEGWDKFSYSVFLNEIDCKKEMSRILSGTDYDANGSPLKNISSDELKEWIDIVSDSMMDTLRKEVCPNK